MKLKTYSSVAATPSPKINNGIENSKCFLGTYYKIGSAKNSGNNIVEMNYESARAECTACVDRELHKIMALIIENILYFLKYQIVEMLPDTPSADYQGHCKSYFQTSIGKIKDSSIVYHNLKDLIESIKLLDLNDKYLEIVLKKTAQEARESRWIAC